LCERRARSSVKCRFSSWVQCPLYAILFLCCGCLNDPINGQQEQKRWQQTSILTRNVSVDWFPYTILQVNLS
jgi:hypothetical protein